MIIKLPVWFIILLCFVLLTEKMALKTPKSGDIIICLTYAKEITETVLAEHVIKTM